MLSTAPGKNDPRVRRIDWPYARLRFREMFRRDDDVDRAHRHTTYETLRHIDLRVARFLEEPPEVQRAAFHLLHRDALTHEAGNRGIGASAVVSGLASLTAVVTAVVAAILAAYLGFADQLTPADADASQGFINSLFQWVAWSLGGLALAVILVWLEGGRRDRRRAMAKTWHQVFMDARSSSATGHIEDSARAVHGPEPTTSAANDGGRGYGRTMSPEPSPSSTPTGGDEAVTTDHARARFARIRLLNQELDALVVDSGTRAASVLNKASFLAVTAGVIVAASTAQLWTSAGVIGVCALVLASLAIFCAAAALRPGKRLGLQAQRLVDLYVDSTKSAQVVEAEIVRSKARVVANHENDLRNRATWVWVGFIMLGAGTISLSLVYALEVIGQ